MTISKEISNVQNRTLITTELTFWIINNKTRIMTIMIIIFLAFIKSPFLKVKHEIKNRKNIYKNIKGHENKINEVLIDLSSKKSGLRKLMLCMNFLYPGKVNSQYKMTRGHKHNADEVYLVLKGKGRIFIGNKKVNVKRGDLITISPNKYHRTVNTGRDKLVFLTIFEKGRHKHLKKWKLLSSWITLKIKKSVKYLKYTM